MSSRPETGDQCASAEARLQGPTGVDASYGEVKARSATMLMGGDGDLATAWYCKCECVCSTQGKVWTGIR
jgi:hypothetical protein